MRAWLGRMLMMLVSLLPAAAAGQGALVPLLRQQEEGIDVRMFQAEAGYLIDLAVPQNGGDAFDLRFFSGEGDITETAQSGPPAAAIVYALAGSDDARQCRAKWRMDTILGQAPATSPAFTESPNTLCPELGIVGTTAEWSQRFEGAADYRRLLVILVDSAGDGSFFDPSGTMVWGRLSLSYALQEDTAALAERLTDFVLPNLTGTLTFLPYPAGDRNAGIRAVIFRNGTEVFALSSIENSEPLDGEADRTTVIVAVIAAILLLGLLAVLATRRSRRASRTAPQTDQPLRAVTIGYGGGFDYSLGADGEAAVARIELYRDGRRKLVRLAPKERIEVDGNDIAEQSWIDEASAIRIAQRNIVVS